MYLSVATTQAPATDLGYLLHKNPTRVHEAELPFGKAHLIYPEATEQRCEAALLLDVDPVALVRGKGQHDGLMDQYVNDRPYAASSFLSVALNRMLRTAMTGASKERPELAASDLPLECVVTPLPTRGGDDLVRALFEPLGWSVEISRLPGPDGEPSRYVTLKLSGQGRLSALLNHLYVLIPVLDDDKHYWVGPDEVGKLLAKGKGWLEDHPARELIVRRYLIHRRSLAEEALARLAPDVVDAETGVDEAAEANPKARGEDQLEAPMRLNDQRMETVTEALKASGATRIADLGCGEGKLLRRLIKERWVSKLIGVDVGIRDLERAKKRLHMDRPGGPDPRLTLLQGSLTYRDTRWEDVDAVALVEVLEHLDEDRLPALAKVVFGAAAPATVVMTTPNAEYNALFPSLPAGAFRHPDHRFEWTRPQFQAWADGVAAEHGYLVSYSDIGALDETLGAPTQMAVFRKGGAA